MFETFTVSSWFRKRGMAKYKVCDLDFLNVFEVDFFLEVDRTYWKLTYKGMLLF